MAACDASRHCVGNEANRYFTISLASMLRTNFSTLYIQIYVYLYVFCKLYTQRVMRMCFTQGGTARIPSTY